MVDCEFDKVIDRRNTGSLKWDKYKDRDVIAMWVADMEFQAPLAVREALRKHIEHGIFGYAAARDELYETIIAKLKKDYGWDIERRWIVWLPGLVPALSVACRCVGQDGDEVATFVPVYPPFLSAPRLARKELKSIPLSCKDNYYTFDIEKFEEAISPRTRLLLLCNPHNPVGRVYSEEELRTIADVCLRNNIIICSDEIHCELIISDKKHVPTATLGKQVADNTITLMSPGKTYNLAGLNCGFAIIPNKSIREKFLTAKEGIVPPVNAFAYTACLAAYRDCEDWRKSLIEYLRQNKQLVYNTVNNKMSGLSMGGVEATYLAWIDTRKLNVPDSVSFFEQAGVGLSDGREFGSNGFVRLNFGCPREMLAEALKRMKAAVIKHLGS